MRQKDGSEGDQALRRPAQPEVGRGRVAPRSQPRSKVSRIGPGRLTVAARRRRIEEARPREVVTKTDENNLKFRAFEEDEVCKLLMYPSMVTNKLLSKRRKGCFGNYCVTIESPNEPMVTHELPSDPARKTGSAENVLP